jgi:prepilin-type N-terminal cleavage/methylation domain-containing protein
VKRIESLRTASGGYSLIELVVVIGILGVLSAIAIPTILSYVEAEKIKGAAREVVALLNQARQLAVTRNISFSVEGDMSPQNRFRFCSGTLTPCPDGTVWIDPATDANGWIRLDNGVLLVAAPGITFTALGAATPGGRLRVQHPTDPTCLDVVVSPSGRATIAAPQSCP